ncbi:hypothetical protein AK88_05573 [Plasmodium fragile]|uniref:Schizont-infected cell agglutination extracellular alpha domain-containing protein n=1 Tax=Plasmodium fragile TaxID=5857 RepID=A0A0D9QCL7_PLAFR|nr:uncharacterized protein AK88_05573 [Plasmodium fragile]KJP84795.1 hypothetical protein AK88_05573 [Plasmodium fragile]
MSTAPKWQREFVDAWTHYVIRNAFKNGTSYLVSTVKRSIDSEVMLDLGRKISEEVDRIFDELTEVIGQSNNANSVICGDLYYQVRTCLRRCQGIVSILLYMRGYGYTAQKWVKANFTKRSAEGFRKYLECILAKEAIIQLYGGSKEHLEIIQEISDTLTNGGTAWTEMYADEICKGQDYGKFIFGSGILEESIRNRLEELESGWAGRRQKGKHGGSGKCTWNDAEHREQEQEPKSNSSCGQRLKKKGEEDKDTKEVMELIKVNETRLSLHLQRIIKNSLEPRVRCKVQTEIKTKIQQGVSDVGASVRTGSTTRTKGPPRQQKGKDSKARVGAGKNTGGARDGGNPAKDSKAPRPNDAAETQAVKPASAKAAPTKPVAANPNAAAGKPPVGTKPENTKTAGSTKIVVRTTTRRMRALCMLIPSRP